MDNIIIDFKLILINCPIRYAVVTYGGVPPFDKPRSIVYNKLIFNNAVDIEHHFKHIKTGAGSMNDTFEALSVASKLIFRPGASKTFILMPCGPCNASNMRVSINRFKHSKIPIRNES